MYKVVFSIICCLFIISCVRNNSTDLILITDIDSSIIIDLKYATEDNFLGKRVYNSDSFKARLLPVVAEHLRAAQKEFKQYGVSLKVWDAFRPLVAQQQMWDILPDARYVSDPAFGGRHTRGAAVDVTLVDIETGQELAMPTKFDDFSVKAHRDYTKLDNKTKKNVTLLEKIMIKHGFVGLRTEWWHFDIINWQDFPVIKQYGN